MHFCGEQIIGCVAISRNIRRKIHCKKSMSTQAYIMFLKLTTKSGPQAARNVSNRNRNKLLTQYTFSCTDRYTNLGPADSQPRKKEREKQLNCRVILAILFSSYRYAQTAFNERSWTFLELYFPVPELHHATPLGSLRYTNRDQRRRQMAWRFELDVVCAWVSAPIGRPYRVPLFTATSDNFARVSRDVDVTCLFRHSPALLRDASIVMQLICCWIWLETDSRGRGRVTHSNFLFKSRIIAYRNRK